MSGPIAPVRRFDAPASATAARAPVVPAPRPQASPPAPALDFNLAAGRAALLAAIAPASLPGPAIVAQADALDEPIRLTHAAIREAAQDLIREAADRQDMAPARFAAATPAVSREKRPSADRADARSTLKTSLLARDDAGDATPVDLHLAKLGPTAWEAAVFHHAPPGAPAFPHAQPPLAVTALQFDAGRGQFVIHETRGLPAVIAGPPGPPGPRPRAALTAPLVLGVAGVFALAAFVAARFAS